MIREELKPLYEEWYGKQQPIQGWEIQDLTEKVKNSIPQLYKTLLEKDIEVWTSVHSMFWGYMWILLGDAKYVEPYHKPLRLIVQSTIQEWGEKYNRRYLNKKKFDWFAEGGNCLKYWWKIKSQAGDVKVVFIFWHDSIEEDLSWKI